MRIAYITPDVADPLAFYRGSGPLSRLRKTHGAEFDYDYLSSEINWASLKRCDMIFMQRPWVGDHMEICNMANKWGIPIVGDFDDWLYDLPVSNPAYHIFNSNKKTFVQIVNALDRITVSNEHLKKMIKTVLLDQEKPIHVIPNAYDTDLVKKYRHAGNVKPRDMVFAWRGGNSHQEDLFSVREDYRNLFKSFPEWQFVFIAQHPWTITHEKEFKNVQTADALKIVEYLRAIHDSKPAIVAHPLIDNDFNRCKSMCSWLEATHARAAFIGPDWEEFKRPGITNYGPEKSFFQAASEMLGEPQKIVENYRASEEYMMQNLTLDKINELRAQVFRDTLASV